MKKQLPGWAVLLIITLIAGLALGGTDALTKDPIAQQALIKAENARKAALPDAETFEEQSLGEGASVDWVYAGLKNGAPIGYVAQKTVNGFGGKVEVITGVDTMNAPDTFKIGGITVGGSDFSETAGLGARAKEPAFTDQFVGKIYPVSYIKAGGEATESTVDALTSATITTTAVVNGVNDIVKYIKADVLGIAGVEMPAKPAEGVFSASEKGFRGPVYVEAAFDGAGKVTYIKVGDESFAEDIGVGVIEPDFMIQFIGKQMPLEVSDIDAIAGATISSTAVVKALNTAYAVAGGAEIVASETPTMPEKPGEGVFSAAEKGFAGPVYVEAAFSEEGKITYLAVGDDQFAETEGFGARALTPEEQYPFIGAQMPLEIDSVDTLTGATFTKTAIVNGLNKAYAASKGEVTEAPTKEQAPAAETEKPETVFGADAEGFEGPVYVEAAFDGDKVTYMSIGDKRFSETEGVGSRALEPEVAAAFIGKTVPVSAADIDVLTGATFTKNAVVEALNRAYAKYQAAQETPAEEPSAAPENTVTASAQGFGGPVAVEAAFDAEGKITYIKIGDDQFAETPGLGARALEEDFQAQFIGKQLPLTLDGIDVLAGATVTSTAVVEALNQAFEHAQPAAPAEPAVVEEPAEEKPAEQTEEPISGSVELKITAGFEDGKLTALSIEPSDAEAAMQEKFLGAEMPVSLDQADTTALTVAVALNKAYSRYLAEQPETAAAEPEKEPAQIEEKAVQNDGFTTVEAISFFTEIQVKAAFEDGKVADLAVADRPVGSEADYAPSAQEEKLKAMFLDQPLPLSVDATLTPYAAAVAGAVNLAYGPVETVHPEEPIAVPAEEPAEEKPEKTSVSELTLRVTAEFENGTLSSLSVLEKAADSEEFTSCAQEEALKEKFIGQALPLETYQPSLLETTAAIAINKAYYNAVHEAEAQQLIGGADEPTSIALTEADDDEPWFIGEAFSFFTAIQAKVKITPELTVEAVEFEEKQIGAEVYQPSERSDELEALFVGEPLPLDVEAYDDPFQAAAAIAINEAFEQSPYMVVYNFNSTSIGVGESISFFTKYTFAAAFTGQTFVTCGGYKTAVGSEIREPLDCGALNELFAGLQMPLSIGEYTMAGVPEYEMTAIVIALNQAYENSLAGLQ